jgi:hypothetical protein
MARCSVCALPSDLRAHGEELIVQGKQYREVAALCAGGVSKSSWFRHMQNCYRARRFYGIGQRAGKEAFRLIVEWPDTKLTLDGQPFTATFRQGDIVLRDAYEQTEVRKLGNPSALITPTMIDEATREYLALFPDAKIAEHEAPAVEEASECVAADDTFSDAAPCEVGEPVTAAENKPCVTSFKSECEHVMVRVSGDISRCVNCGHQEQPPVIVGVSRAWYDKQHNRRGAIRGMGRFG